MTQAESAQRLINDRRAAEGLGRLRRAADLAAGALEHSRNMANGAPFDHAGAADRVPDRYRSRGECIYWTTWRPLSHRFAVASWFNSPPHRRILLGEYTHIGLGRHHHRGRIYWTAILAR